MSALKTIPSPELPAHLFAPDRLNSRGLDISEPAVVQYIEDQLARHRHECFEAAPLLGRTLPESHNTRSRDVHSPANLLDVVGRVRNATAEEMQSAFDVAAEAFPAWSALEVRVKAEALERVASLLESSPGRFIALLVREAGKTIPDALAEIRETIDFCRYYASRGRELLSAPAKLPGPTGELNLLSLHGRGVFACISPWNFPLAILAGQVTAALVAGNTVVAKPAPETPLVAHGFVELLFEAGIPRNVLQLTPAGGADFAAAAFGHLALAGVAFTGSTATARSISHALARDMALSSR